MENLLPADLCKICHSNPSKYRCPRCHTCTCSLPCTKRHKKWAQCSGVRDPTAYRKRSELATPAGIDHDYNFLTSIERKIDSASRDATERGVILYGDDDEEEGRRKRRKQLVKGEAPLKAALEKSEVIVTKAPAGMERAKQNKTFWNRRKHCLVWTVEWIHNNGRSELGRCRATGPIADAYTDHVSQAKETAPANPSKKRPRNPTSPLPLATTNLIANPPPPPSASLSSLPSDKSTSSSASAVPPSPAKPPLHFYLLHPSIPTCSRVMIPLLPTETLATILQNRVVLEFPTIYALKYPPDRLPTGFVTEEDYLKQLAKRQGGGDEKIKAGEFTLEPARRDVGLVDQSVESEAAHAGMDDKKLDEVGLDERALVEVLTRDLGA